MDGNRDASGDDDDDDYRWNNFFSTEIAPRDAATKYNGKCRLIRISVETDDHLYSLTVGCTQNFRSTFSRPTDF